MMIVGSSEGKYDQSEKLKELALHFFKEKGMTARESYNHAFSYLKCLAESWRGKVSEEVYEALINWDIISP